jgi:hypothetical protein
MNPNGPYVSTAALCELVLHEKNEQISCIRFVDTLELTVPADTPDPFPLIVFQVRGLVSFKSGDFVGSKTLKIQLRNPGGKIGRPDQIYPLQFQGNEHGTNLIFQAELQTNQEGLYYFDIFLDEELATRMPLRIKVKRAKPLEPEPTS